MHLKHILGKRCNRRDPRHLLLQPSMVLRVPWYHLLLYALNICPCTLASVRYEPPHLCALAPFCHKRWTSLVFVRKTDPVGALRCARSSKITIHSPSLLSGVCAWEIIRPRKRGWPERVGGCRYALSEDMFKMHQL